MATEKKESVADYLAALPSARRPVIDAVRKVVRRHLPKGYVESRRYGMIVWEVPLARYAETYNGQPLTYAGLASQKNYCALYLMGIYQDPAQLRKLKSAFAASGKKADMGKSCIRFQAPGDLPLDTIGELVGSCAVDEFVARHEAARRKR